MALTIANELQVSAGYAHVGIIQREELLMVTAIAQMSSTHVYLNVKII
jgi:hypothetical protein